MARHRLSGCTTKREQQQGNSRAQCRQRHRRDRARGKRRRQPIHRCLVEAAKAGPLGEQAARGGVAGRPLQVDAGKSDRQGIGVAHQHHAELGQLAAPRRVEAHVQGDPASHVTGQGLAEQPISLSSVELAPEQGGIHAGEKAAAVYRDIAVGISIDLLCVAKYSLPTRALSRQAGHDLSPPVDPRLPHNRPEVLARQEQCAGVTRVGQPLINKQ